MNKLRINLLLLFGIALVLRFLYFPNNIYFGFDQARDAFAALDLAHGDLKIVGPSTSVEGLYHGVLYYYILAPIYFFGRGSVEVASACMRILNALGVFLTFYIATILFNKRVGLLSSLLFAISFEQTQFSIYIGNPSLAVLSIMVMYLGLGLVIFKKKNIGLPIAVLGLGFSVQFQFALLYLVLPFLLIFRKSLFCMPVKIWFFSLLAFLISFSTFILVELKYNFKTLHSLSAVGSSHERNLEDILQTYIFTLSRIVKYNLTGEIRFEGIILIVLLFLFIFYLRKKESRKQVIFLATWFFSIFSTILISGGVTNIENNVPLYYPNVGVSLALLLFIAFLAYQLFTFNKVLGTVLISIVILANLKQIQSLSPRGTIPEINVQQGMLVSHEKQVLDYMYNESNGNPFAIKGVTMPFLINTTWSYLFEYYGRPKYGYLPIWNGKNARGFPGNLKVQEAQEGLPEERYMVIEPVRGIAPHLINEYLQEENYFTKVVEEKKIGEFIVQKREKF